MCDRQKSHIILSTGPSLLYKIRIQWYMLILYEGHIFSDIHICVGHYKLRLSITIHMCIYAQNPSMTFNDLFLSHIFNFDLINDKVYLQFLY